MISDITHCLLQVTKQTHLMSSSDYFQQHTEIKFFQKLGKSPKETLDASCIVYCDNFMLKSLFYKYTKGLWIGEKEVC